MGAIWRGRHLPLKAPIAIKLLDPTLGVDPEMRSRFLQEARAAAAVRSAHVVQVFDFGIEDGTPYIVMELLEGESLDARLAQRGPLTAGELRKVFSEAARGLAKAHSLGVVHRDVKPANVFIAREGPYEITKLVDFGIAKVNSELLHFTHVGTKMGMLLGTPQYMSPEQARGGTVDHRSDLWSLAILACECLTGRCPFSGKTVGDLTVQICTERPSAPSSLGAVPRGFDAWFFRATAKAPAQRFKSVAAMDRALAPILSAAEARAAAAATASRRWSLPNWRRGPGALRSAASGLRARIGAGVLGSVAFVRAKRDAWLWLLPEERRRIMSAAILAACGLALLAASASGRSSAREAARRTPMATIVYGSPGAEQAASAVVVTPFVAAAVPAAQSEAVLAMAEAAAPSSGASSAVAVTSTVLSADSVKSARPAGAPAPNEPGVRPEAAPEAARAPEHAEAQEACAVAAAAAPVVAPTEAPPAAVVAAPRAAPSAAAPPNGAAPSAAAPPNGAAPSAERR